MKLTKALSLGLLLTALTVPALASAETTSAKSLMETATAKATKEKKSVLVIFHASWCGWCKKMDAMLETPKFKKIFENSFVITHVVVQESPAKKDLENAGGFELMTQLGGEKAGLPFFAILNPAGDKVGDSFLANKQNMGFPSEPVEITTFMDLLKKVAPKMSDDDRAAVETYLKNPKAQTTINQR